MKKRLGFLVFALSLSLIAGWSLPADAVYPPCAECEAWSMEPDSPCSCPNWFYHHQNSFCSEWQGICPTDGPIIIYPW